MIRIALVLAATLTIPLIASAQQSPAFISGVSDRADYETWFSGLIAEEQAGAAFWADQRSNPNPPLCSQAGAIDTLAYTGCVEARKRLAPVDAKRLANAEYRKGWNAEPALPSSTIQPMPPPVTAPSQSTSMKVQESLPATSGDGNGTFIVIAALLVCGGMLFSGVRRPGRQNATLATGTVKYMLARSTGVSTAIFGCVFGFLGIITIGLLFVPIAAVLTVVALIQALSGGSATGCILSLLSGCLVIAGVMASPSILVILGIGALIASHP